MLTHPTLDQMHSLGLAGMAAAWRDIAEQDTAGDLTRDEWLGLMLDREIATRADRRLTKACGHLGDSLFSLNRIQDWRRERHLGSTRIERRAVGTGSPCASR